MTTKPVDLDGIEAGTQRSAGWDGPYLRIDVTLALVAELRAARAALARVRACADEMVEDYEPAGESVLAALDGTTS